MWVCTFLYLFSFLYFKKLSYLCVTLTLSISNDRWLLSVNLWEDWKSQHNKLKIREQGEEEKIQWHRSFTYKNKVKVFHFLPGPRGVNDI